MPHKLGQYIDWGISIYSVQKHKQSVSCLLDGIPIEVLVNGSDSLSQIHNLICNVWKGDPIPRNRIDAILISQG